MDVSVVIPCLNCAGVIGEQLDALSHQQWHGQWEVIVADNGSKDETAAAVQRYRGVLPGLRIVDASDRAGAAHARNAGARAARGRAIAFCDADDRVGSGWLAAMADGLEREPFVAARLDLTALNPAEVAQSVKNPQAAGLQRVDYPPYFYHASGATLGVRREAHDAVGGYDENLLYLEDTDYCLRLQRHGYPLTFLPDAIVHYRFKERPRALFQQARNWGQYNVLLYKRYREDMRLPGAWRRHARRWYSLLRRAPSVLHPQQRYVWMKALGTQVGVLQGALRYRVAPVTGWLVVISAKALTIFETFVSHLPH